MSPPQLPSTEITVGVVVGAEEVVLATVLEASVLDASVLEATVEDSVPEATELDSEELVAVATTEDKDEELEPQVPKPSWQPLPQWSVVTPHQPAWEQQEPAS